MTKKDQTTSTYLLRDVPRELWDRAQAKAASLRPPVSMRWLLMTLLEDWVGRKPDTTSGITPTDPYPPVF